MRPYLTHSSTILLVVTNATSSACVVEPPDQTTNTNERSMRNGQHADSGFELKITRATVLLPYFDSGPLAHIARISHNDNGSVFHYVPATDEEMHESFLTDDGALVVVSLVDAKNYAKLSVIGIDNKVCEYDHYDLHLRDFAEGRDIQLVRAHVEPIRFDRNKRLVATAITLNINDVEDAIPPQTTVRIYRLTNNCPPHTPTETILLPSPDEKWSSTVIFDRYELVADSRYVVASHCVLRQNFEAVLHRVGDVKYEDIPALRTSAAITVVRLSDRRIWTCDIPDAYDLCMEKIRMMEESKLGPCLRISDRSDGFTLESGTLPFRYYRVRESENEGEMVYLVTGDTQ